MGYLKRTVLYYLFVLLFFSLGVKTKAQTYANSSSFSSDSLVQSANREGYKYYFKNKRDSIRFMRKMRNESFMTLLKPNGKTQIVIQIPHGKSFRRALNNAEVVLVSSAVAMVTLYFMPESISNWTTSDKELKNIYSRWKENVRAGPVLDRDDLILNYVMHPYFGGVYYNSLRGAGYGWKGSFLYSFFASSLFWEYGVEALAETPSLQDLIITPVVGSAVGELMFKAKINLKKSNDRLFGSLFLGRFALFLLDPLNEFHDVFLKRRIRKHLDPSRSRISSYFVPRVDGLSLGLTVNF